MTTINDKRAALRAVTKPALTIERVRELLDYDPITGEFTWRPGTPRFGTPATTAHSKGYRQICFDGRIYLAHRLAFFVSYGWWPGMVDHKNHRRDDNRLVNLRECSSALNNRNRSSLPASGHRGVDRTGDRWRARIKVAGTFRHLGTFDTAQAAQAAYRAAVIEHFGEIVTD